MNDSENSVPRTTLPQRVTATVIEGLDYRERTPKERGVFQKAGSAIMFRSQRKAALLEVALSNLLYEVTHLSPRNDDGSHNCKISAEAVMLAREALNYAD